MYCSPHRSNKFKVRGEHDPAILDGHQRRKVDNRERNRAACVRVCVCFVCLIGWFTTQLTELYDHIKDSNGVRTYDNEKVKSLLLHFYRRTGSFASHTT